MALTNEDRGRIGDALVRGHYLPRSGVPTLDPNNIRRDFTEVAKRLGLDPHQLFEYVREIVDEKLDAAFDDHEPL